MSKFTAMGLNVAGRLQALTELGVISISGTAYEQVRDKLLLYPPQTWAGPHKVPRLARHGAHVKICGVSSTRRLVKGDSR